MTSDIRGVEFPCHKRLRRSTKKGSLIVNAAETGTWRSPKEGSVYVGRGGAEKERKRLWGQADWFPSTSFYVPEREEPCVRFIKKKGGNIAGERNGKKGLPVGGQIGRRGETGAHHGTNWWKKKGNVRSKGRAPRFKGRGGRGSRAPPHGAGK